MKTVLAGIVALFVAGAGARADLVLVQKVEGAGMLGEQTIKIKGEKSRTDLAQSVSVITDGATGGSTTLMHTGKVFLKVSPEQAKAMMEQLKQQGGSSTPPKLQPTGKKEKVGDYDCEIYTINLGSLATTYWIAKDFPNYPSVLAQLEKFQAGSITAMGQGVMPEMKDFPGMVIKTEIVKDKQKITTTLVSAKEEDVPASVFNIPANYKETTSPTLNFQSPK